MAFFKRAYVLNGEIAYAHPDAPDPASLAEAKDLIARVNNIGSQQYAELSEIANHWKIHNPLLFDGLAQNEEVLTSYKTINNLNPRDHIPPNVLDRLNDRLSGADCKYSYVSTRLAAMHWKEYTTKIATAGSHDQASAQETLAPVKELEVEKKEAGSSDAGSSITGFPVPSKEAGSSDAGSSITGSPVPSPARPAKPATPSGGSGENKTKAAPHQDDSTNSSVLLNSLKSQSTISKKAQKDAKLQGAKGMSEQASARVKKVTDNCPEQLGDSCFGLLGKGVKFVKGWVAAKSPEQVAKVTVESLATCLPKPEENTEEEE